MHRLWYDLRSQALFEASFRDDVLEIDATLEHMIWQVVARYAELRGAPVAMPSSRAYAMFDGLFQQALLRHLAGVEGATTSCATARCSSCGSPSRVSRLYGLVVDSVNVSVLLYVAGPQRVVGLDQPGGTAASPRRWRPAPSVRQQVQRRAARRR